MTTYFGHCNYCGEQLGFGHQPELCPSKAIINVPSLTFQINRTVPSIDPTATENPFVRIAAEYRKEHAEHDDHPCYLAEKELVAGLGRCDWRCATCKAYDALTQKDQP